jgi:fatty-acyl-CoA synthase
MAERPDDAKAAESVSLLHYLEAWVRFRADKPAFTDGETTLTWREADHLSDAIAGQFEAWGVEPGDRLACFLPDCVDWCVAILASLKCGAALVPLNHRFGSYDLQEIVNQVDCKAFISTPALLPRLHDDLRLPESDELAVFFGALPDVVSLSWAEVIERPPPRKRVRRVEDDVAVISFTSGTTGVPKGVMLMDRNIVNMISGMLHAYGWSYNERLLTFSPMAFTGGVITHFMSCLITGGFLYIPPDFRPETALKLIQEQKITFFGAVPPLWDAISQCPGFKDAELAGLKGIIGGSPCAKNVLEAYLAKGVVMRQAYGATEGCGTVTLLSEDTAISKYYTAGQPILNMELRVVDDDFKDCPVGVIGEIIYRGRNMMKGYWRNPEATAQAFRDGWYLSGDLGKLDEDGDIQILDRKKNMIISGGVNVYPAEVERAIRTIPGVVEVAVFGMPHPRWGEAVTCIVRTDEHGLDELAFRSKVRSMLGDFKTPKEILFTQLDFPRTASTKLGRRELPDFYRSIVDAQPPSPVG